MKLFTAVLMMTLAACLVNAQNYLINFAGSGAGITVDSVKVENLSQCTSLSLSGTDTLLLRKEVGIGEITNRNDISLQVSPNPSAGKFSLSIQTPESRGVTLSICDLSGKVLLNRDEILETGKSLFLLGGLKSGLYILNAVSGNSNLTVKIISTGGEGGSPVLLKGGSVPAMNNPLPSSGFSESNGCRGSASVISMKFNPGDTLKLTGKSGIYRTVIMLFPTSSQTVTFPFVDCSDIDGNHYAVVRIGSQLWMGENLRTTKYLDGSDIPNVTDSAAWGSLTTGAYCNFHNLPEEGETYGRLYNFYAVDDSLGICPVGWHVPSTSEWNFLEIYLDSTVDTTALGPSGLMIGRILKEGCDTRWQYWDTTYGINSAGFTALCANFRSAMGGWSLAPDNNHDAGFWTSTSYNTSSAWFRSLRWCYSDIYSLFSFKQGGSSVRCIKDN